MSTVNFQKPEPVLANAEFRNGELRYFRKNPRNIIHSLFVLLCLGIWAQQTYSAVRATLATPVGKLSSGMLFGLVFLALFGGLVISTLIWSLFGTQSLTASLAKLTYTKHVGPFKWSRHFRPDTVQNLRWLDSVTVKGAEGPERTESSLRFDHGSKTITAFAGITEPECVALIEALNKAMGKKREI
jgi:hypothetical protein